MRKFTSGPDWTDVEMTMRALEGLHGGRISLRVSPAGIGSSGGFDVDLSMIWDALPGSDQLRSLSTQAPWPNVSSRDLPAHVWGCMLRLDALISSAMEQSKLPEA